jgi:hypothetical protein
VKDIIASMGDRTAFLARLIGLYCLAAAVAMALQHQGWVTAVTVIVHAPALMLLLGLIVVAAGLALVLSHSVWSGGLLPVTVTVIGWLTLAKGLAFWLLPPAGAAQYLQRLHYEQLYYLYDAVTLAVGLYLTIAGYRARNRRSRSTAAPG